MPLRLDVRRKLLARSDRVKSADLHPTEPWMLVSLYNGNVHIWNYESQTLVKSFEVCDLPVRAAKFVPRKNWIVTGSDDMQLRIFNYNTLEKVHNLEAHSDYLRSVAVHPTLPYVLTSSDDMMVKLWDWDNKWACKQVFEGHTHYVMQVVINPKDNNTFATASLDRTIKVWQLGSAAPNFTLEGHEKGVNAVDYYHGGDKPYLISGADDRLVKIWDYQNKTCVATLDGHAQNISAVCFHPELPIILTGSEDSTVRIWHAATYRLETTLNYGLERVWSILAAKGSNTIAIGYDEGSVAVKLGREEPAVSMDSAGKILWARHSEIQQANLKTMAESGEAIGDGERLGLSVKDMGACEIYPQTIAHNPNGRFVVVCGDGEYIIYTAMALRNKAYGSALEFVWAADSSMYAVRESSTTIKIFKNFKEVRQVRPGGRETEGIFGGALLGVRGSASLCFYDWDSASMIRRIDIAARGLYWSENGEMVAITTDEGFFILRYNAELVAAATAEGRDFGEDGLEDAFEVVGEQSETVKTACWIGDCFVFTTAHNRLNYAVGGEIVTIAHLDRPMYLLGYIPKDSRLYLADKDLAVVSYQLLLPVLEYQTAVMRRDFETADRVLPTVPKDQRTRVAHFLDKQGFKKQALVVSTDAEHRFDLALQLGDLETARALAGEADSEEKWRLLSQVATAKSDLALAGDCLSKAKDFGGMLLLASATGSPGLMADLAENSAEAGQNNVAFVSNLMLGRVEECLEVLVSTGRYPEAAFFARSYCPSAVQRIVALWKESTAKSAPKIAEALADPVAYPNLFPGLNESCKAESYLKALAATPIPAAKFPHVPPNSERSILDELEKAEASGVIRFDESGALISGPGGGKMSAPPRSPATKAAPPSPRKPPTPPPPQRSPSPPAPDEDDFFEDAAAEASVRPPDVASQAAARPDLVSSTANSAARPDIVNSAPPLQSPPQPQPAIVQDAQGDDDDDDGDEEDLDDVDDLDLDNLDIDDDDPDLN